eukprot:jgi/Tetstr1/423078/TSEL_013849.t1
MAAAAPPNNAGCQRIAVLGAGPAGLATTATLLAAGATVDWVDRDFRPAGGLSAWQEVPANTKVDLLLGALADIPGMERWVADPQTYGVKGALAEMVDAPSGWELPVNDDPAPSGWTHLQQLCGVVYAIAEALRHDYGMPANGQPTKLTCWAREAERLKYSSEERRWTVTLRPCGVLGPSETLSVPAVVLAVGGRSKQPPVELAAMLDRAATIPQADALAPSRLKPHLPDPHAPIALVGNSHSAFVVAENLHQLGCTAVTMFGRRPLTFAGWDSSSGKYNANAFGGLKGRSADFAMRHVLGLRKPASPSAATEAARSTFRDSGRAAGASPWLACEPLSNLPSQHAVLGYRHAIFAIGFERAALPEIHIDELPVQVPPGYEGYNCDGNADGQLYGARPEGAPAPLPNVFGCGLAFPHIDASNEQRYEAASIPLFLNRAQAIVSSLMLAFKPQGHL